MLIFLLASSAYAPAEPLIPAFFTGERLYEICAGPNETECWMYVAGVLDGIFAAETGIDKRTICRAEITNREAAKQVTNYLRQNEGVRGKAAAVAVRHALQSQLACPDRGA